MYTVGCIQQLRRREDDACMELSLCVPDADDGDGFLLFKDCTRTQTQGTVPALASEHCHW